MAQRETTARRRFSKGAGCACFGKLDHTQDTVYLQLVVQPAPGAYDLSFCLVFEYWVTVGASAKSRALHIAFCT
eukprot:2903692-Amphidinium_carterae.1